ncbi:MAG: Sigma70-r4 domain-containing protein [Sporanaerobacter sp.]|jgi:DNA-binding NarL/FixJ family response regulator|uniref:hypothetical protein n=1 Tax=Sporanaerobacter sp. TaxID=2010183 RepID=UPI003A0FED02
MKKKSFFSNESRENIDIRDIDELIEMGLDMDEIAKELGISKKHVESLIKDIDKDF